MTCKEAQNFFDAVKGKKIQFCDWPSEQYVIPTKLLVGGAWGHKFVCDDGSIYHVYSGLSKNAWRFYYDTQTFVKKGWGHEQIIINTDKYCGKVLHVRPGKFCSLHFHKLKDETFCVLEGEVFFVLVGDALNTKRMKKDDVVRVFPGMWHQFVCIGKKTAKIMEVSTHHSDDDSYRILKGD